MNWTFKTLRLGTLLTGYTHRIERGVPTPSLLARDRQTNRKKKKKNDRTQSHVYWWSIKTRHKSHEFDLFMQCCEMTLDERVLGHKIWISFSFRAKWKHLNAQYLKCRQFQNTQKSIGLHKKTSAMKSATSQTLGWLRLLTGTNPNKATITLNSKSLDNKWTFIKRFCLP